MLEFAVADGDAARRGGPRRRVGGGEPGRQDGAWRLQVSELHQAMPALLDELRRQGAQLSELRTHSATLEDVFVIAHRAAAA